MRRKYKKGDLFVIEVADVIYKADATVLYSIKGFDSLVFDTKGLDRLAEYARTELYTEDELQAACDEARKEGYEQGYKEVNIKDADPFAKDKEIVEAGCKGFNEGYELGYEDGYNYCKDKYNLSVTHKWIYKFEDGYMIMRDTPFDGEQMAESVEEHGKVTVEYE